MARLLDGTSIFFLRDGDDFLTDQMGYLVPKEEFDRMVKAVYKTYMNVTDEEVKEYNERLSAEYKAERQAMANAPKREQPKKYGFVYFMRTKEETSYVKIGCTSNLKSRIKSMQVVSPHELELVGYVVTKNYMALEKDIHAEFAKFKKMGEWFDVKESQIAELVSNLGENLNLCDVKLVGG